ncbi:MAG: YdcF family protein [Proteobacteria bacterium]|nr:MAG: YdcF family protein [Pseudomonadota bacterium]
MATHPRRKDPLRTVASYSDGRRSSVSKPRRSPVHRPSVWAGALALIILSFLLATRLLGDRLYDYPANPDLSAIPPDAAIVCLAGAKFRIEAAYALFAQGVGRRLFIVGAGKKSTPGNLGRAHAPEALAKMTEERFRDIQVETESRNTIENAFAVSRYLQEHPDVKTIVLVTSAYHMRRAQVVIQHQLHESLNIIPYTSDKEIIGHGTWWHTWLGMEITSVEYLKFLLASLLAPQLGYF